MKFYIIELSSIMFNVKLSLVIFVIFKSININIVDVKYFLYIINGCFIFEWNNLNINDNKIEMVKFWIIIVFSVKFLIIDIGILISLDKSIDISNVCLILNIIC